MAFWQCIADGFLAMLPLVVNTWCWRYRTSAIPWLIYNDILAFSSLDKANLLAAQFAVNSTLQNSALSVICYRRWCHVGYTFRLYYQRWPLCSACMFCPKVHRSCLFFIHKYKREIEELKQILAAFRLFTTTGKSRKTRNQKNRKTKSAAINVRYLITKTTAMNPWTCTRPEISHQSQEIWLRKWRRVNEEKRINKNDADTPKHKNNNSEKEKKQHFNDSGTWKKTPTNKKL